jgi:hypothetical protein
MNQQCHFLSSDIGRYPAHLLRFKYQQYKTTLEKDFEYFRPSLILDVDHITGTNIFSLYFF